MKTIPFASLALASVLPGAVSAAGQASAAPGEAEIELLVRQLGDDRWKVREEATERLPKIGLPALRKAALRRDLEVSVRALSVYKRLTGLAPKQFQAKRFEAEAAFRAGKYEEMAARYVELTDSTQSRRPALSPRASGSSLGAALSAAGGVRLRCDAGFEGVGKGGPNGEDGGQVGVGGGHGGESLGRSVKKSAKVGGRAFATACGGGWLRRGFTGFQDRLLRPLGHPTRCCLRA